MLNQFFTFLMVLGILYIQLLLLKLIAKQGGGDNLYTRVHTRFSKKKPTEVILPKEEEYLHQEPDTSNMQHNDFYDETDNSS